MKNSYFQKTIYTFPLIKDTINSKNHLLIHKSPTDKKISKKYVQPLLKQGGTFIIEKPYSFRIDMKTQNKEKGRDFLFNLLLFFIKNNNELKDINYNQLTQLWYKNIKKNRRQKYFIKKKPEYIYKYNLDYKGHKDFINDKNSQHPHINFQFQEKWKNNKYITKGHIFWLILFLAQRL